jgi:hypothetical protein
MTPKKEFPEEPTAASALLAELQRTLNEERRDNIVHRSGCVADCREHFPIQLLASFTESVTRVESWG